LTERGVISSNRNFILFVWNVSRWKNTDDAVIKVPDQNGSQGIIAILLKNLRFLSTTPLLAREF